ncbi:MAG: hypothetical protein IT289_12960 [Oligoflexia bacterium]|nr:hypothetical protein [Oligoflexia bacterium]
MRVFIFGFLCLFMSNALANEIHKTCHFKMALEDIHIDVGYDSFLKCNHMNVVSGGVSQSFTCAETGSKEMSGEQVQKSEDARLILNRSGIDFRSVSNLKFYNVFTDDDGGGYFFFEATMQNQKDLERRGGVTYMGGVQGFRCLPQI